MNKLLELAKTKLGCGYVWGTQGEVLTPSKLQQLKNEYGAEHYVFQDSEGEVNAQKWCGTQVFDCSGLVLWCLQKLGKLPMDVDYTAEGFYNLCNPIDSNSQLIAGDLVFHKNTFGEIVHIGIFAGGHETIEAKGTRYGVVVGNVEDFNLFGRLKIDGLEDRIMTWKEIIEKYSANPSDWENAITVAVNAVKADGNLGALEIFQFLPQLIEKIGNNTK